MPSAHPSSPSAVTLALVAGGQEHGGAYAVLEARASAGTTVPPHVCAHEDGALLVLAGRVDVVQEHSSRTAGPGELVPLPRARPRRIVAATDVHLLVLGTPAGWERLLTTVVDPTLDPDDRAALLSAAGVALLPAGWGTAVR